MKASEILREAAREVDAHWVRHHFEHAGRVCAVGALRKVAFGDAAMLMPCGAQRREYREAADALAQWFRDHGLVDGIPYGTSDGLIVHVNDVVAKNRKDISSAMEKVAAGLEEREGLR